MSSTKNNILKVEKNNDTKKIIANHILKLLYSTTGSGFAALAAGGDYLSGAMQGMIIHLYNFELHGDEPPGDYYDEKGDLYVMLETTECIGHLTTLAQIRNYLSTTISLVSGVNIFGESLKRFSGNSTIGSNGKLYIHSIDERGFYGNQYIRVHKGMNIGNCIAKKASPIGHILNGYDVFNSYLIDNHIKESQGYTDYYNTVRSSGKWIGGWAGAEVGITIGGEFGFVIGGPIGAVVGSCALGIGCAFVGDSAVEALINKLYGR